ncbi:hypothetical protein JCM10212_003531 [Sporobolomyces blumeae]
MYGSSSSDAGPYALAQPALLARQAYDYAPASSGLVHFARQPSQSPVSEVGAYASTGPSSTQPCSCADCYPTTGPDASIFHTGGPATSFGDTPYPVQSRGLAVPAPPAATSSSYAASTAYDGTNPTPRIYRPIPRPAYFHSLSAPPSRNPTPPVEEPMYFQPLVYQQVGPWPNASLQDPSLRPIPFAQPSPFLGSSTSSASSDRSGGFPPSYLYPPPTTSATEDRTQHRRGSAGSVIDGSILSRRASTFSTSPHGSDHSVGSDDGEAPERSETTTPFMSKLSYLINNGEFRNVIRWNSDGTSFVFAHQAEEFADCLSRVFRHSNSHSFVRQLNIYDFKRLSALELHAAFASVPVPDSKLSSSDFAGFSHPLFFRPTTDRPCDLSKIKPKVPRKPTSNRNLAAASLIVPDRPRALRMDGKVGAAIQRKKF